MARAVSRAIVALVALVTAAHVQAACIIDADGEITNPFETGCGDVVLTYTENDNTGNNIALGFPVPIPVDSLTPVDGFRTYDALFARHQSLMSLHDEVSGEVVGATVANRPIWAYVIGDADAITSHGMAEGAVLVNGGIHAREWQSPEAVTAIMETLIERKNNQSLEQYVIENLTTVLLPVNNIDGFIETQRYPYQATADRNQPRAGRMRRKNHRHPTTGGAIDSELTTVADNFYGIDLNRNEAQGFAQANRSRSSVTSLIYRGEAPASEPEITALHEAANLGPANRLRFFSDTHSFGQVHFAPNTGDSRRNAITAELSSRMRAASERQYTYSPDPPGSPGIGTTADHFAFTYRIPAWTFELEPVNGAQEYGGLAGHGHSGFILPNHEVARMRTDVVGMYLLGFYRQSGPPTAMAGYIVDASTGAVVYDARWELTSPDQRTLRVSNNRALVPGRTYRLWVTFDKPMRVRDSSGNVVRYRGQSAGAEVGTVSLHSSISPEPIVLEAQAQWLSSSGGAPSGYSRYIDDAFAAEFTLPSTLNAATATSAVLRLNIQDLSGMRLDTDPSTPVDFRDGHWEGYEGDLPGAVDIGGSDCSFKPFIAADADATPPTPTATCLIAVVQPTPTPTPPPTAAPSRGSSGGGGSIHMFWLLMLLALTLASKPRDAHVSRSC